MRLEDVVGQPQVTDPLKKSLAAKKISHAYLFVGPRGCGKTSVARIFAHEVNNFPYEIEDDYVDIIEIDGASNRGIDNIRELREKAMIAPTLGKYKIYIIDEVHMLTKEAFNALLKTLEEPPAHVIFVMATTDAYKIPVTITSRAQTYTFKLADRKTMFDFLKMIAKKEQIKIDDAALEIIVKRGGGSFRDTLSLLDQISTLSSENITKELVIRAMGLPESEKVHELLDSYRAGDVVKITTDLKDLLASGIKPETLAEEMIAEILENPDPTVFPLLASLPEIKAPFSEAKLLVALAAQTVNAVPRTMTPKSMAKSPQPVEKSTQPEASPVLPAAPVAPPKETAVSLAFDWDNFVETVRAKNDAIYSQLLKTRHSFSAGELHIYPEKKIAKTILARENNKRILIDAAGGSKVIIHDAGEKPENAPEDTTISMISDIMGGKVHEDGGGNPF